MERVQGVKLEVVGHPQPVERLTVVLPTLEIVITHHLAAVVVARMAAEHRVHMGSLQVEPTVIVEL